MKDKPQTQSKPLAPQLIDIIPASHLNSLVSRVSDYIERARQNVQRTIDTEMITTYWKIGREIVEAEQQGSTRAKYGQALILALSEKLKERYGRGFSEANIKNMRQFYLAYQPYNSNSLNRYTLCSESQGVPDFTGGLGWSHYRILMRIKRPEARTFYEIEASKNNWSSRELQRQVESLLFDRLAKSKDKEGLMKLAYKGHEINHPEDAIKDPVVLE